VQHGLHADLPKALPVCRVHLACTRCFTLFQMLLAIIEYAASTNLLAMLTSFFANMEGMLLEWSLSLSDQRRLYLLVADVLGKVRSGHKAGVRVPTHQLCDDCAECSHCARCADFHRSVNHTTSAPQSGDAAGSQVSLMKFLATFDNDKEVRQPRSDTQTVREILLVHALVHR
jgi:hypothetical protein